LKQMDLPLLMPGEAEAAQAVMAFLLRMRARGISDVAVLRALETTPRDLFVPHRYRDLALRDMALPIPCGQTMPEAWLVAVMMEALDLAPHHRVLEIGAGSGYATAIAARLAEIRAAREATQPVRARTGGSTFKNPPGNRKAWELIDAAGCRGLTLGAAQVSEKHCNFLLNLGGASDADIEALGEEVRARVLAHVTL
jgi:UDP-N-acetylenolpyruvoylglucosamine reductase